jgi:phosphorylase kinase alpha/beta subunit
MHTIRVGHILDILIAREKRAYGDSLDQAFERIMAFKPHELSNALKETLGDYALGETDLLKAERLTPIKSESATEWSLEHDRQAHGATAPDGDYWLHWREKEGSVGREDNAFFEGIFELLGHCEGLMIGGKYNAHRRIDSLDARSHMTPGEQTFKLRITHLLDRIESPAYRQLTVETLRTLSHLVKTYPELHFGDTLVTDILIGHAVRIRWLNGQPGLERTYEEDVAKAWDAFFRLTPEDVSEALVDALAHLSEESPELLRG